MGGKPKTSTPADQRLRRNNPNVGKPKQKSPQTTRANLPAKKTTNGGAKA